ncbi:MAG: ABC transporter ATP-binding protein [Lachnospiraceae bacterium]|nr:ABC transporter ATP-binding protein [Lachnospiraceae bacterium]
MILEVKNLTFAYDKNVVLKNLSFKLESPVVCSILGPNGIGKTTLIKCLLSIIKDFDGEILLDDRTIERIRRKDFYKYVSYVKQGGKENSIYTVLDTVLLGLASGINPLLKPKASDIEKAEEKLEELHIMHLRDKSVSHLSGGEAQMVYMARALVKDPKIIILDEPESNLDYRNQLLVLDIIKGLKDKGQLIIFNTHYPDHALRYSEKTLMLREDYKYIFGDTKEIITKENIEDTFNIRAAVGELRDGNEIYRDIIPLSIR